MILRLETLLEYVALYMSAKDGWIPHDAATVLKNGFADYKGYTLLLQSLLAARGISSQPVLIVGLTKKSV